MVKSSSHRHRLALIFLPPLGLIIRILWTIRSTGPRCFFLRFLPLGPRRAMIRRFPSHLRSAHFFIICRTCGKNKLCFRVFCSINQLSAKVCPGLHLDHYWVIIHTVRFYFKRIQSVTTLARLKQNFLLLNYIQHMKMAPMTCREMKK